MDTVLEISNLKTLLYHVSAINEKYARIAEISGENFNVFKILGLSRYEVRTHTAFIAELLNPLGSHGQKDAFLKLFCERFDYEFDYKNAGLGNKYIGKIPNDYSEGGDLDIIVIDKNNRAIIVENKIDACDQEKQLVRYHKFAGNFTPFILFYLSLDGHDAEPKSRCDLENGKDYYCISYKEHILKWLEQCKEKAVNYPLVRETISQYINLIKHLTHQAMNDNQENEIIDYVIKTPDAYEAALYLSSSLEGIKNRMIQEFFREFEIKLQEINKGFELYSLEGEEVGCKFNKISPDKLEYNTPAGIALNDPKYNFEIGDNKITYCIATWENNPLCHQFILVNNSNGKVIGNVTDFKDYEKISKIMQDEKYESQFTFSGVTKDLTSFAYKDIDNLDGILLKFSRTKNNLINDLIQEIKKELKVWSECINELKAKSLA